MHYIIIDMIKTICIEIDDVLWSKIKSNACLQKKSLKEYLDYILRKDIKNPKL